MLKNRNKWFYAFIIATVLLVAAAVAIVVISVNREEPQIETPIEPGTETGVYYYGVEQGDIILSLNNGNKFTIAGPGLNRSGTYTVNGQNMSFAFVQGNDVATATLGNDVVTMTFNGAVMTFLKQVNYTVTFDTAGGDAVEAVQVCNGKYVQMPADPIKAGHVFIGWYADADCKTPYAFNQAVTGDVTVYAGWVKKDPGSVEYTAVFALGYEGAEQLDQLTTINGQLYNVPTPTREGYTFGGWFVSMYEDGQKLTYAYTKDTVLTANTTLYAVWHEVGGSKLAGPDVSVSATGIKWNAVSGASAYEIKVLDAKNDVVFEDSMGTTSMNFDFAGLEAGDYTVEVIAVSSNTANNSEASVRYFRNKTLDRVSKFQVINGLLVFNAVENAQNYLITIDCGNKDHNHVKLNNGNSTVYNFSNCAMQEGGIRFTVVATAQGYADSVPQTFVYEKNLSAVENLVYDAAGDRFVWDVVENATDYVITVTVGETTVIIHNGINNSFSTAAYSGKISVSVTPVTEGYNSPAAATANCTKTAPAAPQNVRVDGMVITWDAVEGATKYEVKVGSNTYEVTTNRVDLVEKKFDASVGESFQILVKAIAGSEGSGYSEAVTAVYRTLENTLSYSKNTVSWAPVLGCTNFDVRVNGGEATRVSGVNAAQVILTKAGVNVIEVKCADLSSNEWAAIEVFAYEVVYDSRTLGGGEVREYLAIGDSMLLPQNFTNEGYEFDGWYNTPGAAAGNGKEYAETVFSGNGDMALFANWSPKDYDIKFIVDTTITNITNESTQKVTYTKDFQLPPAVTSDASLGYFVGWYTGPSGTGVQVTDSDGNSVAPYDVIGETVVYPYFADALMYEKLPNGTYGVKKGPGITNKSVTEIMIPATYMDTPVTQIIDNGFAKCYNIVSVKIPDTITRVGIGAFERCDSLESIEVYVVDPTSTTQKVYSSADGALLYYDEASGKTYLEVFPRAKTGTYTVPESVDNIRPYAFKYSKLTKVIISKGVTYVAESAFYQCNSLTTIEFEFGREDGVTIENGAFDDLPKVETLILPAKLNVIEDLRMLDKLEALKTIQVEAGGENYSASNNLLCDGLGTSLLYVPNSFAGVFEAPMGITSIATGVFTGKSQLTEVIIPAYVTSIGQVAFYGCEDLTKVTVRGPRNNALEIGISAFQSCESLREVVFEGGSGSDGGVITFGANCFADCQELETLSIGENVVVGIIGSGAFANDISLSDLLIADSAVISQIGEGAFEGCLSIKEYIVHASTSSIGNYAFKGCSYLETVEFAPNGGQIAFGQGVFQDCVRLTTIKLPATLSAFDGSVFDGCEHITNVEVEAGNPYLETKDGALYTMGLTELIYYPRNLTGDLSKLPWDTLTKIGPAVFKGNAKVTSVKIGDKIVEIGNGAFDSCINLTSVEFANMNGEMKIGDNAFNGCSQLDAISVPSGTTSIGAKAFYMTKLAAFTIPEAVTSIGAFAFAYSNLSEIRIPAAVTYIGDGAFYKTTTLHSVTFAGGTEPLVLGAVDLTATSVRHRSESAKTFEHKGVFAGTALTEISLPANISVIGDFTFDGLTGLTAVNIPANSQMKLIGMNAFNKTGISQINLSEGLEFIGEQAFALTKLTTITIPGTVQHLRAYALSSSTLSQIIFAPNDSEDATLTVYNYAMLGAGIAEVTLPAHLTLIGEFNTEYSYHTVSSVFYGNTDYPAPSGIGNAALNKIHVAEGGKHYGSKDGILYTKNEAGELVELQFSPKGNTGDIIIPNTVIHVQHSAFLETQLSSIVFEEFPKDDPRYGTQLLTIGAWEGTNYTCPAVISGVSNVNTTLTLVSFPSHLKAVFSRAFVDLSMKNNVPATLVIKFNPDSLVAFRTAAMRNNRAIREIQLPKVESVAAQAFMGNNYLETLTFAPGSTATELGERAFSGCSKLKSVTIPASISTLGKMCFLGCTELSSFAQEENGNLQTIDSEAFANCYGFTTFKIPDTVTNVGSKAFRYCSSMVTLELSAKMETAVASESSIVQDCSALKEIIVPENHAYLKSVNGILYDKQMTILYIYPEGKGPMTEEIPNTVHTIEGGAFYKYPGTSIKLPASLRYIRNYAFCYAKLESIEIPAGVLEINNNAFNYCSKLIKVTFEEGSRLEVIGGSAFNGANQMSEFEIPDSVNTIGQQAFSSCLKLTKIVLPAALKNLGNFAFSTCRGLTSVTMQEGLEKIGNNAFANCENLTKIEIPDTVQSLGNYVFTTCKMLKEVLMSENSVMTTLGNGVFWNCYDLEKVTFGPAVTTVGLVIFDGCSNLVEVRLPDALTEVPEKLFVNCAYLTTVNIPASATAIGANAFFGCASLKEISFGAELKTIGVNAFSGCTSLTTVNVDSSCALTDIKAGAFENTTSLTGISLPNTVTDIETAAFRNSGIGTVTIPASLTRIGDYAFYGCTNLTTIGIPSTVSAIGAYAFAGCTNVETLALSVGLKNLGDFAFADCVKITEAVIPESVAFMGANPFANCTSLTSVSLDSGNESFVVLDDVIFDKTMYTLICYPVYKTGETYQIPDSVYEIAGGAFAGTQLKSMVLPDNIRKVSDSAFRNCQKLESIIIPGNVSEIAARAFEDCVLLNNLTIPAAVATLGDYAFAGCVGLGNLILEDRKVDMTVGTHLFEGCVSLNKVYDFPGVTKLTDYMYANSGIVNAVIPDSITDLTGIGVFANCASLKNVQFPKNSGTQLGARFFYGCTALENIDIPASITTLGRPGKWDSVNKVNIPSWSEVFMNCTSLKRVSFSARSFPGGSTFENCTSLTTVVVPQNYQAEKRMYANCTSLTADVMKNITAVAEETFLNCTGLTGEIDASSAMQIYAYAFSGCTNITKLILGRLDTLNVMALSGLTANTTVYFKNYTGLDKMANTIGDSVKQLPNNTDAVLEFYQPSGSSQVDYSLTQEEQKMLQNFCERNGIRESAEIEEQWVAYKASFNELNPADTLNKEEAVQLMEFLAGYRLDKMYDELAKQWVEYKKTLAKQLKERFALNAEEIAMVENFCMNFGLKEGFDMVSDKLIAYKMSFADTNPDKELDKEERMQLMLFLESCGIKAGEKEIDALGQDWIAYQQKLAAANKPAASYLTESELAKLQDLARKFGLSEDVLDQIKAAWNEYKLNFTDTKADKEIGKEDFMNLENFVSGLGLGEKEWPRLMEIMAAEWPAYRMELAEKNAKAAITKEEMAWIEDFARNHGVDKEMIAEIQTRLFNYKRFFSETEVSKELSAEEAAQLTAFLEELGVRADKIYPELERQWIEYKMALIKAAGGGDGGR